MEKELWRYCKYLFIVCLLIYGTAACSSDNGDDPLRPDDNQQTVEPYINITTAYNDMASYKGTVIPVIFYTNKNWSASSNQQWLSISPAIGVSGKNQFQITVSQNTEFNERKAVVSIKAESVTKEIAITQEKKYEMILATKEFEIPYFGDTISVRYSANVDCKVECDSEWVFILNNVKARSMEPVELRFAISPNMYGVQRKANIIISNNEKELRDTVSIVQAAPPTDTDKNNPNGNIGNMEWN